MSRRTHLVLWGQNIVGQPTIVHVSAINLPCADHVCVLVRPSLASRAVCGVWRDGGVGCGSVVRGGGRRGEVLIWYGGIEGRRRVKGVLGIETK